MTQDMNATIDETHADTPAVPWTLRAMQIHFALVGIALLLGVVAIAWLIYPDFDRIRLGAGLRITNPGSIYEQETQISLFLMVSLGLLSVIPFRAVAGLIGRYRRSILVARLISLGLLIGIPIAGFMTLYIVNLPADRDQMSTSQQLIDEAALAILAAMTVLFTQALLTLWYQVWLSRAGTRDLLSKRESRRFVLLHRLRVVGLVLGLLVFIAIAVVLGVLTDWLYERPVARPDPGELLYATTFDAFNDEWKLFPGRDSAAIVASDEAAIQTDELTGQVLAIEYGTGKSGEVVWSVLDRKFSDFDLRVTVQLVDGPFDQNKIGVGFRYKDTENFYYFGLTADGYYGLVKVTDGVPVEESQWGASDLIDQTKTAHEIRIVARGSSFQFFVDGVLMPLCLRGNNLNSLWQSPGVCWEGGELTTVYRDDAFSQGRIALAAGTWDGSDIRVAFDDVLIVGPEPLSIDSIDNDGAE